MTQLQIAPAEPAFARPAQATFVPTPAQAEASQLTAFRRHVEALRGRPFAHYREFECWAVEEYRDFWRLSLEWSATPHQGSPAVVSTSDSCEQATFFPDLRLSYADTLLRTEVFPADAVAVIACGGSGARVSLTRGELREAVAAMALGLRRLGVVEGDRVAAVVRNTADAVIAALAVAAIGAVFSSAAPEMGAYSTLRASASSSPPCSSPTTRAHPAPPRRPSASPRSCPAWRACST